MLYKRTWRNRDTHQNTCINSRSWYNSNWKPSTKYLIMTSNLCSKTHDDKWYGSLGDTTPSSLTAMPRDLWIWASSCSDSAWHCSHSTTKCASFLLILETFLKLTSSVSWYGYCSICFKTRTVYRSNTPYTLAQRLTHLLTISVSHAVASGSKEGGRLLCMIELLTKTDGWKSSGCDSTCYIENHEQPKYVETRPLLSSSHFSKRSY